jgi:ABC-type methionine transport system permease subunit
MVSAARRPARAGLGMAKHNAIKRATTKTRLMVVTATVLAVLFEFIRGFICVLSNSTPAA